MNIVANVIKDIFLFTITKMHMLLFLFWNFILIINQFIEYTYNFNFFCQPWLLDFYSNFKLSKSITMILNFATFDRADSAECLDLKRISYKLTCRNSTSDVDQNRTRTNADWGKKSRSNVVIYDKVTQ
jgi:hypothetical protein